MKKRFRGKSRTATSSGGPGSGIATGARAAVEPAPWPEHRRRDFYAVWQSLYEHCRDQGSRARLQRLREQFERQQRGVSEPAQAEADAASLMRHAGFSVAFLEESGDRTADLECYWGDDRVFVEVTAIIPGGLGEKRQGVPQRLAVSQPDDEDDLLHRDALVRRLAARLAEKGRQLDRYCAPVILVVTVPVLARVVSQGDEDGDVDVQRLAGWLSAALQDVPPVSALMVTCWNLRAKQPRASIRLSHAVWVMRSEQDASAPRIRLFIVNQRAAYPLGSQEIRALHAAL